MTLTLKNFAAYNSYIFRFIFNTTFAFSFGNVKSSDFAAERMVCTPK